jgi:hypothetical protein
LKIYAIVEGDGEVAAVPVLLRRLLHDHAQRFDLQIGQPIRRKEFEFRRPETVQNAVRLAKLQADCAGIILLFDGEDDCPAQLGAQVSTWAKQAAGSTPCEVAIAYREYETWFLASLESLRGHCRITLDACSPDDPESRRNAKGKLEEFMPRGASYSPTIHQSKLTAVADLAQTHRRNRSFRKFTKAVGDILAAMGTPPTQWPPKGW